MMPDLSTLNCTIIEQFYINNVDSPMIEQQRFRRAGNKCFYTEKGPGVLSRDEFEIEIDENFYNEMKKSINKAAIVKTRFDYHCNE